MRMKVAAFVFFIATVSLAVILGHLAVLIPFAFAIVFGVYGMAKSSRAKLNILNDAPNAFRVFLASLGGYLLTVDGTFIFPALAVVLLSLALYLNDEYQRLAWRSIRTGRRGGSVALLGIDGSGKSTHSVATNAWLQGRGYRVKLMPFHTYLFVERLSSIATIGGGARRRRNPLRPFASLLDNLLLQISSSIGCRLEGVVVLYDRFIWSTYIKYEALGYPVKPLSYLYLIPRPFYAIVLDVPVEKSLRVIDQRVLHTRYPGSVLQQERERYLDIARRHGYPIIDATVSFEQVQAKIEAHLQLLFPAVHGGKRA